MRPPVPQWDGAPPPDAWEAKPDERWIVLPVPDEERRCRWGRPSCKAPSVARFNRGRYKTFGRRRPDGSYGEMDLGRIDSWWNYCAEHMYGRWIEDREVMQWTLRPDWRTR